MLAGGDEARAQNSVYISKIIANEVDRFVSNEHMTQSGYNKLSNKLENLLREDPYLIA